ncbi:MAG: DUF4292 domain-containing protein [Bacteroidota bacterium]
MSPSLPSSPLARPASWARAGAGLLLVALVVVAAGCGGTRRVAPPTALPEAFPNHTIDQIHAQIAQAADTLTGFSARARLSINSPAQKGSFSSSIQHRRADSLYMSLSPGLGIEAARALITPDSFFVYDRINSRVIYGDFALVTAFFPISGEDLFQNMLGLVQPPRDPTWALTNDSTYYYLRAPDGTERYTIDPALWRVVRYEQRRPDGTLLEDRAYLEFDQFEGLFLPRRLVLRRPEDASTASIYYRDVNLNPRSYRFALDVRSSATWIPAETLQESGD